LASARSSDGGRGAEPAPDGADGEEMLMRKVKEIRAKRVKNKTPEPDGLRLGEFDDFCPHLLPHLLPQK